MDELQTCVSIQVGNSSPDEQEEPIKEVKNIYSDRRDCIAIKEKLMKLVNKEEYTETLIAYLRGACSKQFFDEKMSSILTTPAAKIIHNDLIRSILFNAHFTMTPPPNVKTPIPQAPHFIENKKHSIAGFNNSFISNTPNPISNYLSDSSNLENSENSNNFTFQKYKKSQMNPLKEMKNYTAYNMRHLPSIFQLASRVESFVSEKNIDSVDINAVKIIFQELKATIITLLKYSIICHQNRNSSDDGDKDDVDMNSNNANNDSDSFINVSEVLNAIEGNEKLNSFISLPILTKYSSLVNK